MKRGQFKFLPPLGTSSGTGQESKKEIAQGPGRMELKILKDKSKVRGDF